MRSNEPLQGGISIMSLGVGFALFLIGGVALLIVLGDSASNGDVQPLAPVRVAAYEGDISVLVYLAEEEGYFAEEGLDVMITGFDSGREAFDEVLAGRADVATAAEFPIVLASFERSDVRVVSSIATEDGLNQIVARTDEGVETVDDLRGKTIATVRGSETEFYLDRFLELSGIESGEVEVVYMSAGEIEAAVLSGAVDGAAIWDPIAYRIKMGLAGEYAHFDIQEQVVSYFLLLSTDEWVASNPDEAKAFMDALARAEQFVQRDSEAVKDFVIAELGGDDKAYLDEVFGTKIRPSIGLPQSLISILEKEATWAMQQGFVDTAGNEMPNYLDFISFGPLEAARPDSITIIR